MDATLATFLLDPANYPDKTSAVQRIETHISYIFITDNFAYKFKKPVRFDFLDFSTLKLRHKSCKREGALNRRFAPSMYLGVVPLYQVGNSYSFEAGSSVVEYAVKMVRFDRDSLFSELLERGELAEKHLSKLVEQITAFHRIANPAPERWGIDQVGEVVAANLEAMGQHVPEVLSAENVATLRVRFSEALRQNAELITKRQLEFVRALHGDLHLRNICLMRGEPQMFDGIEFNDELACSDTWADLAFLLMDLEYRQRRDLATFVINLYLEHIDDFEGVALLDLYVAYRACVRAKVSLYELATIEDSSRHAHARSSIRAHVDLALRHLQRHTPLLIAVGGFSGSGKTTVSRALAQAMDAIHVRSDVVRKHLCGIELLQKAPLTAYQSEVDNQVYEGMLMRARPAVESCHTVILDAVHRTKERRDRVEDFARQLGVPFVGIWCSVEKACAIERVKNRAHDASDATPAIVERQYSNPLVELTWHTVGTQQPLEEIILKIQSLCATRQTRAL